MLPCGKINTCIIHKAIILRSKDRKFRTALDSPALADDLVWVIPYNNSLRHQYYCITNLKLT